MSRTDGFVWSSRSYRRGSSPAGSSAVGLPGNEMTTPSGSWIEV
jgi:hypothetical protein